jgi:hypothetical protein
MKKVFKFIGLAILVGFVLKALDILLAMIYVGVMIGQ